MTKPSIGNQTTHLKEICAYYEVNVFATPEKSKEIKALNKAVLATFTWMSQNEQRIKTALQPPAKPKTDQSKTKKAVDPPKDNTPKDKDADAVKHAATLCNHANFQEFLKWKWKDAGCTFVPTGSKEEIAAHQVRALTSVKSRAQFNKTQKAARAWQNLFHQYKSWEQYGS